MTGEQRSVRVMIAASSKVSFMSKVVMSSGVLDVAGNVLIVIASLAMTMLNWTLDAHSALKCPTCR